MEQLQCDSFVHAPRFLSQTASCLLALESTTLVALQVVFFITKPDMEDEGQQWNKRVVKLKKPTKGTYTAQALEFH